MSADFIFKAVQGHKVVVFWAHSEKTYRKITYYLTKRQTGDGALSVEQTVSNIQRLLQKPHKYHQLDVNSAEGQEYAQRTRQWMEQSPQRTEQAAAALSKMLTPLQDAGIIGPTKCLIL